MLTQTPSQLGRGKPRPLTPPPWRLDPLKKCAQGLRANTCLSLWVPPHFSEAQTIFNLYCKCMTTKYNVVILVEHASGKRKREMDDKFPLTTPA